MADLKINIKVDGEEKIASLDKKIESLDSKTKMSTVSIAGWTTGLVAVGYALKEVVSAGTEYQETLDNMNGVTNVVNETTERLSTSFGSFSAGLLEATGAITAYKAVADTLVETFDYWNAFFSDKTVAQIKQQQIEVLTYADNVKKLKDAMKEMEVQAKAYNKVLAEEARQRDIATEALARYQGQQQQKVNAHKEELKVLAELLNIYEEQGRNTDELINKIEKLEQVDVLHIKTIREKAEELAKATSEIKENTDAVEENTGAIQDNTGATQENAGSQGGLMSAAEQNGRSVDPSKTYRSSGRVISGAEAYANYYMGTPTRANDYSEEMLRELKKLNNKVGR